LQRYLLSDDRPHARLEGVPRPRWPDAWPRAQHPPDNGFVAERASRLVQREIEIRNLPGALDDVNQLVPVRQMRAEQQMVCAAANELEYPRVAVDDDRSPVRVGRDVLHAGDRASRKVCEQRIPVERAAKREPQNEAAVGREPVRLTA